MDINEQVQIQTMTSSEIGLGHVAVIITNCPMVEVSEGVIKPGIKMSARQAIEVAINIIHIAKIAEMQELQARMERGEING